MWRMDIVRESSIGKNNRNDFVLARYLLMMIICLDTTVCNESLFTYTYRNIIADLITFYAYLSV